MSNTEPLINILIRTHRPALLRRCLESVESQTYKNYRVILHTTVGRTPDYEYNLFCNDLKSQVTDGWFFFLDDDDVLIDPTALKRISVHLDNPFQGVICQFLRNGKAKPGPGAFYYKKIWRGMIGMPCIFMHHTDKHIVDFEATEDADFLFIKEVSTMLPLKWVQEVIVDAGKRSHGK